MTSARANRAYSIDRMMFEELVFSLLQSQDGMNTRTEYRVPVAVAEDYRRGDLGAAYTRDLELKMVLDGPLDGVDASPDEDESDAPSLTATFAGSMGLFVVEDMALAPLYEHLARGEAPPMSDTDVMSLGVWRNFGEAYTINDAPLYSTEYWEADLSSFHWLIPSAIGYETKGGVYDLAGVMSMIEGFSAADPEAAAGLASVRALLAETGLERIAFDVEGTLNWSPQTGASAARSDLAVADIMDLTMETEGGLPTYDEIAAIDYSAVQWGAAADDDVGETSHWDELGALFASRSTIASHRTALVDHGGLEKGFAVAVASANLAAEYGEANPLAGSDPVDLRQTASTLIRVSGGQMGVVAPQLVGFAQAAADFIDESGALIVALSPAAPFAVMDLVQRLQTGAITPEQAIEETGLTVEHLPSDTE